MREFDSVLLDLDGVVYAGPHAVPGAVSALDALLHENLPYGFVTNNASRTAADISDQLVDLGLSSRPEQVVTSGIVAARALGEALPTGSRVLVIGSPALADLVAEAGLEPVHRFADEPAAVVQGFSKEIGWHQIAEACQAVASGLAWWATNLDFTMPTDRGLLPGNGAFVSIVAETTGRRPQVAGKPGAAMLRTAAEVIGGSRPIMVGDRLDTDIAAAVAAGIDSALVLTGIHDVHDAVRAPRGLRPSRIIGVLPELLDPVPEVTVDGDTARCGEASAHLREGVLTAAGPAVQAANAALALVVELSDDESANLVIADSVPRRTEAVVEGGAESVRHR
ncbi:HAD-IIA family hydrolase [Brevibacterium daeguense]|nr:HAD-IIA family hydrolase [Brevibacterium daeguense]